MPLCVLDASVTIAALIEEDRSADARDILHKIIGDSAVVPYLWLFEVGNVLLIAQRRRSLTAAARRAHLDDLSRLPIVVDRVGAAHPWHDAMTLAEQGQITLYDAAYLELSLRLGLPLASFDAALCRAAHAAGVTLL